MALDTVVAQGDTVVVLGQYTWRVKATGRCFTSDFAHAFHLADGKVERFQEFLDTAAVAAAHQSR
jgi:ketosteroid isomerase-like protein